MWVDEIKFVLACPYCARIWVGTTTSLEIHECVEGVHGVNFSYRVRIVVERRVDNISDAYIEELIYVVALL
jgi:hypothetical protein